MKAILVALILVVLSHAGPTEDCSQLQGCEEVLSDDGNWGTWRSIHYANQKPAYAMKMRVEGKRWWGGDDTAANGLQVSFRDMFTI